MPSRSFSCQCGVRGVRCGRCWVEGLRLLRIAGIMRGSTGSLSRSWLCPWLSVEDVGRSVAERGARASTGMVWRGGVGWCERVDGVVLRWL